MESRLEGRSYDEWRGLLFRFWEWGLSRGRQGAGVREGASVGMVDVRVDE